MDRQIVYPGSIPLDTDLLSIQRNTMVALGYLTQATLGASTFVDGLECFATTPASLTIVLNPGSIGSFGAIDAAAFGSLPADNVEPLVRMGVSTNLTNLTLTAPATSGQSINYLIQASFSETDTTAIVLPYYNAANPALPFSGPGNSGIAENTQRIQRVQFQVKPSAPANAGSQVTPPVDAGWSGLYVVTVNYGQTQITSSSIATYPGAPFIAFKLSGLTPGFSRMATFTASGNFVVPNGSTSVRVRLCGGGGGGASGQGGAGGGAGGYAEGIVQVTPGQVIPITVAGGGAAGNVAAATAGGTSNFGSAMSATGGSGGGNAQSFASGGAPGAGFGGSLNLRGGYGSDGNAGTVMFAGNGGVSYFGGGGRAASTGSATEQIALAPGSGGGAAYSVSGAGGPGAPGVVIVEF
ncbi:glycine-rich domain-containing protein [Acidisphaera sp. L21]|uniref:glycine-rich domain-containing protein n=1 Tax=Acidisphaera sp. L21 TaxID=1641851 RepID=UPI00131C3F25|nr:hypothetical protein [Acidisphaera sp. L21]